MVGASLIPLAGQCHARPRLPVVHLLPMTVTPSDHSHLAYPYLANHLQAQQQEAVSRRIAGHQHPPYPHETTYLILQTRAAQPRTNHQQATALKSIQQLSNATYVRNDSLVPTTSDHICERIPMSDPSSVLSVARHSHVNTTANDTRASTAERRNSSAKANSAPEASGVVEEDSPVPMHWADISGPKPDECASNLSSTKKQPSGNDSAC